MAFISLPRPLYPPDHPKHSKPGRDIVGHKRALWRTGHLAGPAADFDEEFDRPMERALKEYQRENGILATGNLGTKTYLKLRATPPDDGSTKSAYDALADKYLKQGFPPEETPDQKARRLGVAAAAFWIVHRDEIAYAGLNDQPRPMVMVKPPTVPKKMDCSWLTTTVYWAAGAPDPNGRGYDGQGYTGTQVSRGHSVSHHEALPMDLVFYGFTMSASPAFPYGSPTHVAVYIGGGMVASHGGQSGPVKTRMNYRPIHSVRRYELS